MHETDCEPKAMSQVNRLGQMQAEYAEKALRMPTTREKLLDRKALMEKHLSDVNAALEALDKFPEFEAIHNLLTKVQL